MAERFRTGGRAHVRSAAQRIVEGPMVPLGVNTQVAPDLTERFERRAFAHMYRAPNRVWLRVWHRIAADTHVIGAGVKLHDSDEGLIGEFRVVNSPLGDEWLAMAADDLIDLQWSIGFNEVRSHWEDGVLVHTRADAFEQAFVGQGAYGPAARVAAVREGNPPRLIDSLPPLPRLRSLNL